jgi:putative phosphoesterase
VRAVLIGVISDTHGNLAGWRRAWELGLGDCELIVHCGDILYHGPKFLPVEGYSPKDLAAAINACEQPVLIARGNADSDVDQLVFDLPIQSPYAFATLDGLRLLVTHGHLLPPDELTRLAERWRIDLLLTGHVHTPFIRPFGRALHINPGTVTYPLGAEDDPRRRTFCLIRDGLPSIIDIDSGEPVMTIT